nr:tetratricopeptide repeat protein [Streptomyces sp. 150FB]
MHGSAKDVQMLAALALDAGKPVPLETLIQRLWDDAPPGKPRSSLHSCATRIRSRLETGQLPQEAHAYTLAVDPDVVDYHRYQRLTTQARSLAASGDDTQALALHQQAEALWRGEPLTGFTGIWAEQVRRSLAEQRLAAVLSRTGIELRMGHYAEVTGELSALVERHPTDETVARYFMTAAYGRGRQTDALRCYESLRRLLREDGTEPGEALVRTYRLILDGAPVGDLLGERAPGTAPPVPNNLPAHSELVGRAGELGLLQTPLSGVIAFQSISGMAGVGKSHLALHAARSLARHYPDGQIHINLRAHSPDPRPLSPKTALMTLLRHFGVPGTAVPHDLEELTALWRTMLSTRRAIIILDDAADREQLDRLLPGTSPSLILITSRRRLTGLPGIRHVLLDILPTAEAVALFTRLVGPQRATDMPGIATLVHLCGRLPLALELVAGRLNSRPTWTVSHLVERMSHGPRLAEIRDGNSEIASAFALSYDTLPDDQQTVFRLLSLHPGADFGPHSGAALTGLPLGIVERILESLLDSNLVQEPAPDRYRFHDLIGEFALTLAVSQDTECAREAALDRLAEFCLGAAAEADRLLHPRRPRLDPPFTPSAHTLPTWAHPGQAMSWLTAEHTALTAAERHFRSRGRPAHAALLAHALAGFLDAEGHWEEAEEIHTHAVRHWRTAGERAREAHALIDLADVQSQTARYEEAEGSAQRALAAAREAGDSAGEAEALRTQGLLYWNLGRLNDSLRIQQEALNISLNAGDPIRIATGQDNVGIALLQLGNHAGASTFFREALVGFIHEKNSRGEAQALNNLGELHLRMGEIDSARQSFNRAYEIFLKVGTLFEQATGRLNKANTMRIPRELNEALDLWRQGLAICRRIRDRRTEAVMLNAIGTGLHKAGLHTEAAAHHTAALNLSQTIGAAQEEAQALRGLGMAELHSGRPAVASEHLTAALSVARRINATEEIARSCSALAELEIAAGRDGAALRHLEKALPLFEGLNRFEFDRIRSQVNKIRHTVDLRD